MTRDGIITALVLAAGLGGWLWHSDREKSRSVEQRHARARAAASKLNGPPKVREVYNGPHGTLIELRFVSDAMVDGILDSRACYVWRDAAGAGSALSCPSEKEIVLADE